MLPHGLVFRYESRRTLTTDAPGHDETFWYNSNETVKERGKERKVKRSFCRLIPCCCGKYVSNNSVVGDAPVRKMRLLIAKGVHYILHLVTTTTTKSRSIRLCYLRVLGFCIDIGNLCVHVS